MAELLIKIGGGANYEDGDCLCAFSDRRIGCTHAEMICHPKRGERNASGLLLRNTLTEHWMRQVYQYRFERVSATEVERVIQSTGQRERFGPESMDVRLYVRRRKRRDNHLLFGEDGREVWFGGRSDTSPQTLARIWQRIEQETTHRRTDDRCRLWPMGRLDIRSHLALRVESITEKQAEDFVEPQYEVDDNGDFVWDLIDGETVSETQSTPAMDTPPDERPGWQLAVAAKRRRKVPWALLLGDIAESTEAIVDPSVPIGHEIDEPEGRRYTSKTQAEQRHTRIEKKPERRRARP